MQFSQLTFNSLYMMNPKSSSYTLLVSLFCLIFLLTLISDHLIEYYYYFLIWLILHPLVRSVFQSINISYGNITNFYELSFILALFSRLKSSQLRIYIKLLISFDYPIRSVRILFLNLVKIPPIFFLIKKKLQICFIYKINKRLNRYNF